MEPVKIQAIDALLVRTEQAHGVYETSELNGVYDTEWPRWYGAFAVEHGLGDLLGHALTPEGVATFLTGAFANFEQQPEPDSTEPWSAYIARRMADEL